MFLFLSLQTDINNTGANVPEESLLIRAGAGDKEAFEELYKLTSHAVFGFALSILKNRHDAEDVMQDTFLKIRMAAHLYEPRKKPMAWILTITRNYCLMKLRSQKASSYLNYEDLENNIDYSFAADTESRLVLEAAFRILSEQERQIIMLHALSGLKHREIAAILKLPLSTVLSKYKRALEKLKKEISGKEQGHE